MRIAFITYEFPPDTGKGGIGTYVSQIAKALTDMQWDVHVFAGSQDRSGSFTINGYNLHLTQCKDPENFKYAVVGSFVSQHSLTAFDIIESPEIHGNAWEIKKRYPSIPLVVRLHAPNYLVESLKKKYIPFFAKLRFVAGSVRRFKFDWGYWRNYNIFNDPDYQFIQLANYVTAPSEAMKSWVIDNWEMNAGAITVIPNIFSASETLLNIPIVQEHQYKRIIFFGRLNALKGLVNATGAMKKILQEFPGWRFRVIGDDGPGPTNAHSMRNWMKTKLHRAIERVEFLDGMDYENLVDAIKEGEIVLLPSLFESFSYTCAEAMAAGKAVVGSKNGGMTDLLQNDDSGILIDPDKPNDIYAALKKLVNNNDYRYRLSVNARKRIINNFDAKRAVIKFKIFYENISKEQFAQAKMHL